MGTQPDKHDASADPRTSGFPASRVFGKFRLLANLGAGGMGEVFLALSRTSVGGVNKLIVIKRLKHFAEDEARSEARQMFLNEARLATLLNHPNIVQTNDVGLEDDHLYLTMEYLEGQPLNAIVKAAKARGAKIEDSVVLKIVSDALAGLHYAHELRDYDGTLLSIVHRDLSPHNLFVTYEGMVKILDFGIAKSAGSVRTEQGVIKGKFAYMAPEQAATDEVVDRRADVFVMGIVLWELLTGERLVYRRNDVQTVHRLLNDPFPPPSSVRPQIPPELDAIVMCALEKHPDQRFQTARAMRDALEEFLLARSKPVRQEDIAPIVCELFDEERSQIRARIRQCIATTADDAGLESLPVLTSKVLDPSGSTPQAHTPTGDGSASETLAISSTGATGEVSGSRAAGRPGRLALVAGGAVAAVALIAVGVVLGTRGHAPPAGTMEAPVATVPAAGPSQSPAAPATTTAEVAPAASASAAEPAASSSPVHFGAIVPRTYPPAFHGRPAATAPAPPTATAAAPTSAPTPAPTSTTRGRVFNTSL